MYLIELYIMIFVFGCMFCICVFLVLQFSCYQAAEAGKPKQIVVQQQQQRRSSNMSVFVNLEQGSSIEVFELVKRFTDDKFADKVNLSVGGK